MEKVQAWVRLIALALTGAVGLAVFSKFKMVHWNWGALPLLGLAGFSFALSGIFAWLAFKPVRWGAFWKRFGAGLVGLGLIAAIGLCGKDQVLYYFWLSVVLFNLFVYLNFSECLIFSGVFFSCERFPAVIQPLIKALPLTALNDALRASILEGTPLIHQWPRLLVMFLWGGVSFVLALRWFRWT